MCVDKATTGTYSFASFISNVPAPVELVITQVGDHVKTKSTSQLINNILKVLQNLLKYFNGIIIATSFSLPAAGDVPVK